MVQKTFREHYCNAYNVSSESFSKSIILQACYPHAQVFYQTLLKLGDTRVEPEVQLICDIQDIESVENLEAMINGVYFATYLRSLSVVRKKLKLRISGSKIIKMARTVFKA